MPKCGEGFHFKSNKSKHLKGCPERNGPDKYVGQAPYDATIEATFKKRAAVPLQVVPQQAAVNPQQQAVVNPALVIQPDDPDPENAEPQRTQDQDMIQKETTPYEEEAKKAIENIEGEALLNMMAQKETTPYEEEAKRAVENIEALLNMMAGGIIPDSRKVDVGDSEAKPEIDVEMHFDDDDD